MLIPESTKPFPLSHLLRIGAAALLLAGLALAVAPIFNAQVSVASVSESQGTVQRATKEVWLLKTAMDEAEADLVAADEERKTTEFKAVIGKSLSSTFIGTFETKQSVQEEYDEAMQTAADVRNRVADKVDAADAELAAAERELTLEEETLAVREKTVEQAESNVQVCAGVGGALVLAAAGVFGWTLRERFAPKSKVNETGPTAT